MKMHFRKKKYGAAVFIVLLALVLMPLAVAAAEVTIANLEDIPSWKKVEGVRELSPVQTAQEAVLWGDPQSGEHAIINQWGYNVRSGWHTRASDARIVVVRGTFAVSIEGQRARELDSGGFVLIPQGVKHNFGCAAMGRCAFMLYQNGPAGIQAAPPPAP
jgi:glyoxylate utilization-related uncharacterized protein